jgi:hypothetical protein
MGEFDAGFNFDLGHQDVPAQSPWDFQGKTPLHRLCMQHLHKLACGAADVAIAVG